MAMHYLHDHKLPAAFVLSQPSLAPTLDGEGERSIPLEWAWRQSPRTDFAPEAERAILASRWSDDRPFGQANHGGRATGRHVIAIAMKTTRLRLIRASQTLFEGAMAAGTVYVTDESLPLKLEFQGPCDFIHLYVPGEGSIGDRSGDSASGSLERRNLDGFVMRDALAEGLARSLIDVGDACSDRYAESVGQTIVMRVLAQLSERSKIGGAKVNPLPRWRLKRVYDYVAANLGEPVSLPDLASAAGLSRMHFAAQFRAATGYRPHEYLLFCRIERAKDMLAREEAALVEIALTVGFQAQAHFSTVFKRLTGQTPLQWRRASLDAVASNRVSAPRNRGAAPARAQV